MPKLNQVLAVEKTIKTVNGELVTGAYQQLQKTALMEGLARNYTPKDDDGDKLPPEIKNVQTTVEDLLKTITDAHIKIYDITATKDFGNCSGKASADVVIAGQTLIKDAPAVYLVWLEKQLTDIYTVVKKLPVLDPAERWERDASQNYYVTEAVGTTKTRKVPRNHVKAEATQHHPAQVETYTEDQVIGMWETMKFSGAITVGRRRQLLERVETLQEAVKFAREKANAAEVPSISVGSDIFGYLLAD